MNHSVIEVVFRADADLQIGEELRVSGNVPALGCDDPKRSIPLYTSPVDYPRWHTKEGVFLPGDVGAVKYRYCVFSGGKFNRWEFVNPECKRDLAPKRSKLLVKLTEDKVGKLNYIPQSPDKADLKINTTGEDASRRAKRFAEWSRKAHLDNELKPRDGVIIVSYFLPVTLSKTGSTWSAQWETENLLSLQLNARTVWIGSIRYQNNPIPVEEEDAVARVLLELNCFPVFINQNMHFQFYDIFCKQNLWPILHHIADVYQPLNQNDLGAKAQQNLWFVYTTVHKLFREKVLEVYQNNYLIWIHGFHLMMLPSFVRRRIPNAKIGYFFHTPFPSSEIWRTMSRREDLLRGLLGADQIGFHLFEYARHFLVVCQRLLGYNSETNASGMMTVQVDGREVNITCIHVGVDLQRVEDVFRHNSFLEQTKMWKQKFQGQVIIAGIDRLERLKGIPLKLMAINRFMEQNPKWIGKIVFALIGISAGERGRDYRQTQHDVKILVEGLNSRFASDSTNPNHHPLVYFEERHDRDIRLIQRLGFFAAADVLLMTAARDGLNRYPMEYTLAREKFKDLNAEWGQPAIGVPGQGVVIISEFISSARVMRGAVIVNPWQVDEVKEAIRHCLEMTDSERNDRMRRNLEFSCRLTTVNWAMQVLHDLKAVEKSSDPDASYAVGFGLHYKVMNLKAGSRQLDFKEVSKCYRNARHRLIVLDWGGTLVSDNEKTDKLTAYALATGHASREGPTAELRKILETLCQDPKNVVFVVSGKEQPAVSDFFGDFKGLGLGAEHGFYYRWPRFEDGFNTNNPVYSTHHRHTHDHHKGKWQTIMEVGDQTWKESAKMIMELFVQRTHGTYIEQKGNALIWKYSEADPEFGHMQSKELVEHLHMILATYPVEIIRGGNSNDGYIEVRPTGASKGLFLEHLMSSLKVMNIEVDFMLAVGDDISDEPMFKHINEVLSTENQLPNELQSNRLSAFGVTVGKKPTSASGYVDDASSVLELLNALTKYSAREKKHVSMVDLPSQVHTYGQFQDLRSEERQTNLPIMRANSDGNLELRESENSPFKNHLGPGLLNSRSDMEDHEEFIFKQFQSESIEIKRETSSLNLTEYMNHINSLDEGDDEGIFF